MSYILDALRKAESERQLGHVPGVHAQVAPVASSKPLVGWIIVFLLVLIAVLLAWRMLVPTAPQATGAPAAATSAPATSVVSAAPVATPSAAISPPASPLQGAEPAVNVAAVPVQATPLARQTSAPAIGQIAPARADSHPNTAITAVVAQTKPAVTTAAVVAPASAVLPARAASAESVAGRTDSAAVIKTPAAASPAPAEPDADEALPLLAQLPELIQREVPPIAVKGYMYSKNPADRVLIVGSNFHHEGDDFPNGVRLEKLLPKAAVFSYKGFRYRVAY